ncbi:hypothetical protein [Desulfocicer niacini]
MLCSNLAARIGRTPFTESTHPGRDGRLGYITGDAGCSNLNNGQHPMVYLGRHGESWHTVMVHRHLGALKVNPNLDALILIFSQGTCGASAFEKDALNFKEM